ncbi:MAG: hypothetical protein JWM50_212 [Microbacteriaceae bacterium]|jgi:hypothetical protein|nr:hypothetical protein [Microbacteriaceae bacterium]
MSVAIDIFERMFEYEEMPPAVSLLSPVAPARLGAEAGAGADAAPDAKSQKVLELQSRIRSMQSTKLDTRSLPTHPAIARLLPGGGLQEGSVYSVVGSTTLLMALLAGPSAAGSWCGVVGVPEFGIEAAARFGIDLDRLVLVPHPGDQWLGVTSAIADVMGVVVARPPKRASDGAVTRLAARLRQRGSTLIVLGAWPQSEAILTLSQSDWSGIGNGNGYLEARQATVTVTSTGGRPRSARLWLPDQEEQFREVTPLYARGASPESAPRESAPRESEPRHERRAATG